MRDILTEAECIFCAAENDVNCVAGGEGCAGGAENTGLEFACPGNPAGMSGALKNFLRRQKEYLEESNGNKNT